MSSVASVARAQRQRDRAGNFQAERNLPRVQRLALWWNELALGIFNLGLSRRRWSLVGSWLHLHCPDKRLQRRQRRWWHLEGEELKEIKARGKEAAAAPRQGAAPAPAPAPEPEPENEEEEPEWHPAPPQRGDRAAPQVNVQVHINVQNAQSSEPAFGA